MKSKASAHSTIKGRAGSGYVWRQIAVDEGLLLRAMAICMIMAHNYMHWMPGSPGENEFGFQADRVGLLLDGLWQTPWDAARLLASYFGHYGVQVFFFLSGYGLTKKYGSKIPGWWGFQIKRWKALYPAVILSALGYLIYEGFRVGWGELGLGDYLNLLRQMVGVSNFIPENVYRPIGPWWFIGVILQFYMILPLIWRGLQKYGDKALYVILLVGWVLQSVLGHVMYTQYDLNINHTILGHLGICAMGIWFARRDEVAVPWWMIAVSVVLFAGANFYYVLWIPSSVVLLLFFLPLLRGLCAALGHSRFCRAVLLLLGQLSLYLFLCNGYLRRPLGEWAKQEYHWWTSIWTCFAFMVIVVIWAAMFHELERRIFLVLSRRKL